MKSIFNLAAAAALCFTGAAGAADLMLYTENYGPLNFEKDGQIVGQGADQVFEMLTRANISYDVELTKWSRAIGQTKTQNNTCVFSTTHTDERDAQFKWIEPLAIDRTVLVRRAGSDITLNSIDDALSYSTGTQNGDYTVGLLEAAGFTNIDLAPDQAGTVKKLLAGRIDLMAASDKFLKVALADGIELEVALVLSTATMALACNLDTDQALIDNMQATLQEMIDDGTQAAMIAKYK